MKKCAVCWNPEPKNPKNWKRGTNETTWICKPCRAKKANRYWRMTPMDEFGVDDLELFQALEELPTESGPGRFENATAIEVMKLYCMDVGTVERISSMVGVNRSWAFKVIAHWRDNHGQLVERLREWFAGRIATGNM